MDNVISIADRKKDKEAKEKKAKVSTSEKIRLALKKWGSFASSKDRKNNVDGTKKDK